MQSPSYENATLNAKLEVLFVKINGLERSTWIKKWGRYEKNLQRLKGKLYFKSQNKSLNLFKLDEWEGLLSSNNVQWNLNKN